MDIALETVCQIILQARAVDVKEDDTDPDSGSNPIDDGATDTLTDGEGDPSETLLRDMIDGLNDDERADLVALVYLGRGDLEPEEWNAAVGLARERATAGTAVSTYLLGIPKVGDLLEEGLDGLGLSCT